MKNTSPQTEDAQHKIRIKVMETIPKHITIGKKKKKREKSLKEPQGGRAHYREGNDATFRGPLSSNNANQKVTEHL